MHDLSSTSKRTRHAPLATLKIVAYTLIAPFLLIAVLSALLSVVLDFSWFRIRQTIVGRPPPKGVWEF